jgi:hypothetical protein
LLHAHGSARPVPLIMHTDEGHRPEMQVEYECTCNECETVSTMNTSASAPSSGASPAEWLLTAAGKRVSVSRAHQLPRRRPVRRHPGIYYRPRRDGKVGPPYEIRYPRLERQAPLGGRARQSRGRGGAAGGAPLAPAPRRADRTEPANLRAVRERVARAADASPAHARALQLRSTST